MERPWPCLPAVLLPLPRGLALRSPALGRAGLRVLGSAPQVCPSGREHVSLAVRRGVTARKSLLWNFADHAECRPFLSCTGEAASPPPPPRSGLTPKVLSHCISCVLASSLGSGRGGTAWQATLPFALSTRRCKSSKPHRASAASSGKQEDSQGPGLTVKLKWGNRHWGQPVDPKHPRVLS